MYKKKSSGWTHFLAKSHTGRHSTPMCSIFVPSHPPPVKSGLYSPIFKEHKAKIKCARAAGADKRPELLRTEVQLGRGNHHPTALYTQLYEPQKIIS